MALPREKEGDFVRAIIFEKTASKVAVTPIEKWPGVACTDDNCKIALSCGGCEVTVLATRTANEIPAMEMAAACKGVDIVVSDRLLPRSCRPKWIKADRKFLTQKGGLAF